MYSLNAITIEQIQNLKDIQLSELLHTLLKNEASKEKLEDWDYSVPFNITTGDGGSDGKIRWNGTPTSTDRWKRKFVIYQNKATGIRA